MGVHAHNHVDRREARCSRKQKQRSYRHREKAPLQLLS